MSVEFKLPELGENIESGDVVRVLVAVGDQVVEEQPVIELETDKATIEVPSGVTGRITDLPVAAGDKITVGQVVLVVDADADADPSSSTEPAPAPEPASDPEPQAEPEAAAEAPREREAATGESARALTAVESGERPSREGPRGTVVDIGRGGRSAPAESARPPAPAAPSVRRLARELGVDVADVRGSGPRGRIGADDVKRHARQLVQGGAPAAGRPRAERSSPLPDFTKWGEVEQQAMSNVRRATAEHLSEAWATIPHVTQYDRADITALEQLRERFGKRAEAAGGKLTVTAIALKAVASALKEFPQFNSSVDMANQAIVYKRYVHIGVAVDTDRGLLVPVIRDVDTKSILELSTELTQVAEKARTRKLTLDDMAGGTFTITNLGGLGGTHFAPIINLPEVAILGISRAEQAPVLVDGRFQPRLMLPLSLSYDHRVIDGADAVRFLRWVVDALEQPFLMAL